MAVHLFHIAQEAIANAIRHGGATQIDIALTEQAACRTLTVTDNGSGFDPPSISAEAGVGLCLMQYRAALIGGSIELSSQPGSGTHIVCSFPASITNDEDTDRIHFHTRNAQRAQTAQSHSRR
jgi:signal transduction histidine kinase